MCRVGAVLCVSVCGVRVGTFTNLMFDNICIILHEVHCSILI